MPKSVSNSCHIDQTYSVPLIIAGFNKANRGISPFVQKGRGCEEHASASLNDGKGESREIKSKELMSAPLKYRKLDLDSIEAGEVVHVLPEVSLHHLLHSITNLISCL